MISDKSIPKRVPTEPADEMSEGIYLSHPPGINRQSIILHRPIAADASLNA